MHTYVFKASRATWTVAGLAGITWCVVAMAAITDSGGPVRDGRCDRCGGCDRVRPTCAEVITRRVPVKKEVQRKVPAVEWKVEERCCQCRHDEEDRP